jgi:hypothetical protein
MLGRATKKKVGVSGRTTKRQLRNPPGPECSHSARTLFEDVGEEGLQMEDAIARYEQVVVLAVRPVGSRGPASATPANPHKRVVSA